MRDRLNNQACKCFAFVLFVAFLSLAANAELVALYNFEDGTANDSVGGHNGTLLGNAAIAIGDTPDIGGTYALDLDGNSTAGTRMTIAKAGWWNNTTFSAGFTVSFWLKVPEISLNSIVPFAASPYQGIDIGVYQMGQYGWFGGNGVSQPATQYHWQVDNFAPAKLIKGGWHQYAFAYDRAGSLQTAYRDGSVVAGPVTAYDGITFIETLAGGVPGGVVVIGNDAYRSRYTTGLMDEIAFWNHAVTPTEMANAYANGVRPSYLLPDNFEDYADTADLQTLWSNSNGSVTLETGIIKEGDQSMRVNMTAAGTVTKQIAGLTSDYLIFEGKNFRVWTKGQTGQAGNLTFNVVDANDVVKATAVYTGGLGSNNWNYTDIPVEDPNAWSRVESIKIVSSAPGTFYVDNIMFADVTVPHLIVHWGFNESSGEIASDSSGNNIDGTLHASFEDADWVVDGGHTGQAGDNALRFVESDPNLAVTAHNVVLPQGIGNIFSGSSSWTINQWIYLDKAANYNMFGGFGDALSGAAGVQRYLIGSAPNGVNEPYFWGATGACDMNFAVPFDVGKWQMITFTYDGDSQVFRGYKNAVQIGEKVLTLSDTAHDIMVSPDPRGGVLPNYLSFDGLIDDFMIWDDALPYEDEDENSANDILSLWGSYTCLEADQPAGDFNGDCSVDMADFAEFATQWLECTRYPVSFCQ